MPQPSRPFPPPPPRADYRYLSELGIPVDGTAVVESVSWDAGDFVDVSTFDSPNKRIPIGNGELTVKIRTPSIDWKRAGHAIGPINGSIVLPKPENEATLWDWFKEIAWPWMLWKAWNW